MMDSIGLFMNFLYEKLKNTLSENDEKLLKNFSKSEILVVRYRSYLDMLLIFLKGVL